MVSERDRPPEVLRNKRSATRFQVLATVAANQPAVSQREIADVIGVTTQAVSEYLRDLADLGHVRKLGRGRYEITKEGVDWLLSASEALEAYLTHLTGDILDAVEMDTAIATASIDAGETVTLWMDDGTLLANPGDDGGGATAVAVTSADADQEVGVTDWEGVIDYEIGSVTIVTVPTVSEGGSDRVDLDRLAEVAGDSDLVAAHGTEAIAALGRIECDPDVRYGTPAAVQEAAARGLDVLLVCVQSALTDHVERLDELDIAYELLEPSR